MRVLEENIYIFDFIGIIWEKKMEIQEIPSKLFCIY